MEDPNAKAPLLEAGRHVLKETFHPPKAFDRPSGKDEDFVGQIGVSNRLNFRVLMLSSLGVLSGREF